MGFRDGSHNLFGHMSRSLADNLEVAHNGINGLGVRLKILKIQVSVYSMIRSMDARMSLILRSHFLSGMNGLFQNVVPEFFVQRVGSSQIHFTTQMVLNSLRSLTN